jgi:uncharacterized membrane protein
MGLRIHFRFDFASIRIYYDNMSLAKHVKTKFLTGLFVLIPAIITAYVVYVVVSSVDGIIYPIIVKLTRTITGREIFIPGSGIFILLVVAYITGIFATNYVGKKMLRLGETLLTKIPFVKSIYSSVKDMTDAFSSQTKKAFKEAVLTDFPFKGRRTIGFITRRTTTEQGGTICSVFIPTTPNPTSGYLIMVPEEELTFLEISVDQALKYVISLGTARIDLK